MKIFSFIILPISIVLIFIILWNKEKYPLNADYIKAFYQIDLTNRVNSKDCISVRNQHTVILKLTEQEVLQLLSKDLPGYSHWREVTTDESYGNSDFLIDGFVNKNLMMSYRVTNSFEQRIIVNKVNGEVILTSS